ncbi:hypothetical protein D6789_00895 [Candidatus Woesearchaeota archaeon]|nr:MAG: hypothetical protein D6789_00895 [Candidatus Woesearchaeota archaeon]
MGCVRGQVSVEYLVIIAFTFAILVPALYFFSAFSQDSSSNVAAAQNVRLGNEMIATSVKVVAQGSGSWLTLETTVPDGVKEINVSKDGKELVITFDSPYGETSAVFFSDLTLNASLSHGLGGSVFRSGAHAGLTKFRFTAQESGQVAIEERP